MMDDILGPRLEIDDRLREMGVDVWAPDKVVIISDHYTPVSYTHLDVYKRQNRPSAA